MESFELICRLCLNQSSPLVPIFETRIEAAPTSDVIRRICHKIALDENEEENNNLPKNICEECYEILRKAHNLSEISAYNEKELQNLLSDTAAKTENEDCEETITFENDPDFSLKSAKRVVRRLERKFECKTCHKMFEKPSKLTRHEKTHDTNKKPYACEVSDCFQRFALPESLQRHQIIHSGMTIKIASDSIKPCVICLKEFDTQEAMASHMRIHKNELETLEFPCNLCDKVFRKLNELTRHSKTHTENKNYKCQICAKVFSQGSHLIDHLNRHSGLRPHVCNICAKSFQQSSTLKDHIRTHSKEKPFLCSACGKSFNNPSNLRQHVKRHLNLKEFECHLCPGKFSCKASLQSHLRSHSGIKSHSCEVCGAQFTKGSSLKKHVRSIHEGIKDHECTTCFMKFSSGEHLKRHFRTHSGEKPFICDFLSCGKAYAQSNDLLKHKKIHIGENVYKCTDCMESFRLKSQLRDHYVIHKNTDVE